MSADLGRRRAACASDEQIADLIDRVGHTRDRWAAAEIKTLEDQQARSTDLGNALRELDLAIWSRRKPGETVAQVRARLAPGMIW